jgi:protein ImuB
MERLPYVARMAFAEPIGRTEDVEAALHTLLESLCARLEKDRKGARRLTLEVFRVDNTAQHLHAGTGKAVRQPGHLFRLFREKIDSLDAGFGIEFLLLTVTVAEPLGIEQEALPQTSKSIASTPSNPGRDLALLIDRLEGRLGTGRVARPRMRDTHIPEQAVGLVPALSAGHRQALPRQEDREAGLLHSDRVRLRPGARPIYLLPKPEPVYPLPVQSDAPQLKAVPLIGFEWRRSAYRLAAADGPERIAGRWWRGQLPPDRSDDGASYFALCEDGGAVRDYWRMESETGLRFWVFHLPFPLAGSYPNQAARWFIHGLFA